MPNKFKRTNCRPQFLFGFSEPRLIFEVGKTLDKPQAEAKVAGAKALTIDELENVLPPGDKVDKIKGKIEAGKEAIHDAAQARRSKMAEALGVGMTPANTPPKRPTGSSDIVQSKPAESKEKPLSKLTGHEFIQKIKTMSPEEREKAIEQAVTKENIPAFKDVKFKFKDATGKEHDAEFSITKDAIKVGEPNDPDHPQVRMPMSAETGQKLAKRFEYMLPTSDMIDRAMQDPGFAKIVMPTSREIGIPDVEVTLPDGTKKKAPDGRMMKDPEFYEKHDKAINSAFALQNTGSMSLEDKGQIGGKKIVVIGAGLNNGNPKLNFHGGLKPDGSFYQNDDLAHEWPYADYSHSVYFAKKTWKIDGVAMDVSEVIKKYPGLVGKVGLSEDVYAYYKKEGSAKPAPLNNKPVEVMATNAPVIPQKSRSERVAGITESSATTPRSSAEISTAPNEAVGYFPERTSAPSSTPARVETAKAKSGAVAKSSDQSPERKESKNIEGPTLFLGDSIMKGTPIEANLQVNGQREIIAQENKTVDWLLKQLFDQEGKLKNPEMLGKMQNIVCLIGTNDIGGNRPVNELLADIQKIAKIKEKYPKLNIYICTIPPIKGYQNYDKDFKRINARRNQLNDLILSRAGNAYQVIQLHKLMADNPNDSGNAKLGQSYDSVDHLHPQKNALAALLQSEIGKMQDYRSEGGKSARNEAIIKAKKEQNAGILAQPELSKSKNPLTDPRFNDVDRTEIQAQAKLLLKTMQVGDPPKLCYTKSGKPYYVVATNHFNHPEIDPNGVTGNSVHTVEV